MRRITLVAAALLAVCALPATTAVAAPVGHLGTSSNSKAVAHPQLVCDLAPFLPGCGLWGNPL